MLAACLRLGRSYGRLGAVKPLTVRDISALSYFDDVSVGIADVAANLSVLSKRLSEELRTPTFPQLVARLNIRHADVHKATDLVRVGGDAQRYRRLVRGGTAADVHDEPCVRDLNVPGRSLAVASAQNAAAENLFIEIR